MLFLEKFLASFNWMDILDNGTNGSIYSSCTASNVQNMGGVQPSNIKSALHVVCAHDRHGTVRQYSLQFVTRVMNIKSASVTRLAQCIVYM